MPMGVRAYVIHDVIGAEDHEDEDAAIGTVL
jgi:hypothetical protein